MPRARQRAGRFSLGMGQRLGIAAALLGDPGVLIFDEQVNGLDQAILTSPARHATLSSPGALRAVVGVGLFLGACGLLALGIALVVPHTAGAISAYVFVMLVLPFAIAGLPASLGHDIERFLPESIGAVIIGDGVPNGFAPWTGLGILCAYAAVVLAAGTVLLVRRDA